MTRKVGSVFEFASCPGFGVGRSLAKARWLPALHSPALMGASLTGRSAASEDDALDGYAFRRLPGRVNDGTLARGRAEPRVGVGTRFP